MKILPTPFLADRGDDRKRLDRVLRRRLGFTAGLSRTRLQELIEAGAVTVNGRVVTRPSARVLEGDRLQLAGVEPRPRPRPQPEPIPLQVLHEDEHLIVVEKPAGMVSHPAFRHASGTLLNALLDYARGWPPGTQPLLAGRLDKLTSGLVVAAKRPAAHAALVRSLGAPGAEKVYFASCRRGCPGRGARCASRSAVTPSTGAASWRPPGKGSRPKLAITCSRAAAGAGPV